MYIRFLNFIVCPLVKYPRVKAAPVAGGNGSYHQSLRSAGKPLSTFRHDREAVGEPPARRGSDGACRHHHRDYLPLDTFDSCPGTRDRIWDLIAAGRPDALLQYLEDTCDPVLSSLPQPVSTNRNPSTADLHHRPFGPDQFQTQRVRRTNHLHVGRFDDIRPSWDALPRCVAGSRWASTRKAPYRLQRSGPDARS